MRDPRLPQFPTVFEAELERLYNECRGEKEHSYLFVTLPVRQRPDENNSDCKFHSVRLKDDPLGALSLLRHRNRTVIVALDLLDPDGFEGQWPYKAGQITNVSILRQYPVINIADQSHIKPAMAKKATGQRYTPPPYIRAVVSSQRASTCESGGHQRPKPLP